MYFAVVVFLVDSSQLIPDRPAIKPDEEGRQESIYPAAVRQLEHLNLERKTSMTQSMLFYSSKRFFIYRSTYSLVKIGLANSRNGKRKECEYHRQAPGSKGEKDSESEA